MTWFKLDHKHERISFLRNIQEAHTVTIRTNTNIISMNILDKFLEERGDIVIRRIKEKGQTLVKTNSIYSVINADTVKEVASEFLKFLVSNFMGSKVPQGWRIFKWANFGKDIYREHEDIRSQFK